MYNGQNPSPQLGRGRASPVSAPRPSPLIYRGSPSQLSYVRTPSVQRTSPILLANSPQNAIDERIGSQDLNAYYDRRGLELARQHASIPQYSRDNETQPRNGVFRDAAGRLQYESVGKHQSPSKYHYVPRLSPSPQSRRRPDDKSYYR